MSSITTAKRELQILLAGFGGQGVLFAGKIISYAALIEDRQLSWLPSYGPEMRGGTANCSVTISDNPIGSPLVLTPNVLIAMNQPSWQKFHLTLVDDGLIIADSSLCRDTYQTPNVKTVLIPAQELAEDAGLKGLGNVILVGNLFAETNFCSRETLDASIEKCVPPKKSEMIDLNKRALQIGIDFV